MRNVRGITPSGGTFETYRPMISAAAGLTLGQVCAITGLEPSTVQNWVKRGFVARPENKKYGERQLARILLISSLKDGMRIEDVGALLRYVNGDVNDESDDILPEDRLYDCFCRATEIGAEKAAAELRLAARSEKRLAAALEIMVNACAAGEYRRKAETLLSKLKEN